MWLSDFAGGLSSVIMWMSPLLIAWMMGIGLNFLSLWQSTVDSGEKISHSSRNVRAAVCSFPPSGVDINFISSASLSVSACCPSSPVSPPPSPSEGLSSLSLSWFPSASGSSPVTSVSSPVSSPPLFSGGFSSLPLSWSQSALGSSPVSSGSGIG